MSSRIGRRLIEDFLLPALDEQKYGDRLCWVDKNAGYFSIKWNHKNAAKWTLEDTVVFQDWDKLKGHYHPEIKGYYMQAKQRFRAALYKLSTVRKVCSKEKHTKIYQLVQVDDKKKPIDTAPVSHPKYVREVLGIPTPVICRNINYVPSKPVLSESISQSDFLKNESAESFASSSSNDSLSSDRSDTVCMVAESNNHSASNENYQERTPKPVESLSHKTWHVPVQPLPEYTRPSRCIAHDLAIINNPKAKEYLIKKDEEMDITPYALNLSIKPNSYQRPRIPISAR